MLTFFPPDFLLYYLWHTLFISLPFPCLLVHIACCLVLFFFDAPRTYTYHVLIIFSFEVRLLIVELCFINYLKKKLLLFIHELIDCFIDSKGRPRVIHVTPHIRMLCRMVQYKHNIFMWINCGRIQENTIYKVGC